MKPTRATVVVVIPARYASTRFPGKPLALIHGTPMILWTYNRASAASCTNRIVVATDHEDIYDTVRKAGGEAVMTATDLPSGSDRVAVAASGIDADIVVNIQGDEPVINPGFIDAAVEILLGDPGSDASTLAAGIRSYEELWDENTVKVLIDRFHRAIYFSRAPIPYPGDRCRTGPIPDGDRFYRHIGLYAYRRSLLMEIPRMEQSRAERIEKLEQLRLLDHGRNIAVREVPLGGPSVDVPGDIARVERYIAEHEIALKAVSKNTNGAPGR
ncbi:3-deoxy-manno-octulosonate cytidylyltransferase [bacterium]|nr:3-deoxy-manno-octulosonate cytidylyltransferase [candidate division CSSED10-310 bacterium]